jgi:hypothetical protein
VPPPPPRNDENKSNQDEEPFRGRPDFENFDGEEDPMEAFFNQIFGDLGPDGGAREGRRSEGGTHPKSAAPRHASSRLKELYRALVRRLHPDTQPEMTAQKSEMWHAAQKAYQAGDAEQLEVILTLCEIGDSGTTAHTSASLLQRITAQMKHSLREIKRQIAARRNDPARGFSRRVDHQELVLQMRRTMTRDLEELQDRWRDIQGLIAAWKAAAERLKKPRRRKAPTQGMEFPF